MSLCHLYSGSSSYPYLDQLLNSFAKNISLDVNTISTLDSYDICLIELQEVDKELSRKIVKLFKDNEYTLIYFIIPENHTLFLFQLAFLLKTEAIITHTQNVEKAIEKIKIDFEHFKQKNDTNSKVNTFGFISSRITFIEILKEKILQRNSSSQNLCALVINIKNTKVLLTKLSIVKFEEALYNMLLFIEKSLSDKLIFSQFENNSYTILFENKNFNELNTYINDFHKKISNYMNKKTHKIINDFFTYDLNNRDFDEILTTLNKLSEENFKITTDNSHYIYQLKSTEQKTDLKTLLDNVYKDSSDLKILNIYHGLVINTTSEILKITDKNIYISFDSLQGVVLNMEKNTVLQSDIFPQDIYAEIKQINLQKKIAILENFKFLKSNANSRKYARVTTQIKVPISIYIGKSSVQGSILDLSIKSIAVRMKYNEKMPKIIAQKVSLVFNLSDSSAENGYIQLVLDAKIIFVTDTNDKGNYNIICDLDQYSHDLDIVSKYVYRRQKELIIELKKMSKLN
ncbi:MAG: PilZ domain-containing protein [Sulfurimonas sp.]|nr:PilZ domain-containing protein [Sulfurimonas sp.]PHQ91102.1 MAG: hypothetical protein COB42_03885 [Sulfurimonas sp.]